MCACNSHHLVTILWMSRLQILSGIPPPKTKQMKNLYNFYGTYLVVHRTAHRERGSHQSVCNTPGTEKEVQSSFSAPGCDFADHQHSQMSPASSAKQNYRNCRPQLHPIARKTYCKCVCVCVYMICTEQLHRWWVFFLLASDHFEWPSENSSQNLPSGRSP